MEEVPARVRDQRATYLRPIGLRFAYLGTLYGRPPTSTEQISLAIEKKKFINTSIILDHMHAKSTYNCNGSHHYTNTLHFKIVLWVIITHIVAQLLGAPASLFIQFNNTIVPSSTLALLPLIINE